jgi:hypothetical protein
MRTKALLLVAAALAAGAATSMAQTAVYSVNAVGYVNTALPKGFSLISNPLRAPTNTVAALFANANLPEGFKVFKFVPTGTPVTAPVKVGYNIVTWEFGDWSDTALANALTVNPGEGVFVQSPSAYTVTFVGEVPQGVGAQALNTALVPGYQIVSSQVPQAGKLSTDLKYTPVEGDKVFRFVDGKYAITPYEFGDWTGGEPTINVGEAFFLQRSTAGTWTREFNVNQ